MKKLIAILALSCAFLAFVGVPLASASVLCAALRFPGGSSCTYCFIVNSDGSLGGCVTNCRGGCGLN